MTLSYEAQAKQHAAAVRMRLMNPPRKPVESKEVQPKILVMPEPAKEWWELGSHVTLPKAKWRSITEEVAAKYQVTIPEIMSPRHYYKIAAARREIWWRLSKETPMSLTQIAERFNRDHTTILWGIRKHQRELTHEKASNRVARASEGMAQVRA